MARHGVVYYDVTPAQSLSSTHSTYHARAYRLRAINFGLGGAGSVELFLCLDWD